MNTHRENDAPVTGGRAPSSTEAPGSRAEPGSRGPVLSTGPEPFSAAGPGSGARARPPAPAPTGPALRVVLVSRDNMLAGALRSLIEAPGGVRVLDWHSDELDSAIRHADVVVVDMPPNLHQRTFPVIDGRFLGRTVVLLQEGEHPEALPPGPARAILYRPLQIGELWGAVTGALPTVAPPLPGIAEAEESESEELASKREVVEAGVAEPEAEAPEAEEPEVEVPEEDELSPGVGIEVPGPHPADASRPDSGPTALDRAPVVEGQGLPVAELGRLIGLSGQELEPVIGPGQVAPGMDEETLERLRRWGNRGRQPAARTTVGRAKARAAVREQARQAKEAQARERQAAREQSRQAQAEARRAAAEASQQSKEAQSAERTATREAARQAKDARAAEQAAARERARQAKATRAAERTAAREAARQTKEARAAEEAAAREAARKAKAAEAAELAAAREAARKVRAEEAEARRAARAAQAEQRRVARAEAGRERAAQAQVRREEALQARAARAEARKEARAEAARQRAARAEARKAAQEEARTARTARAEERRAERAQARQEIRPGTQQGTWPEARQVPRQGTWAGATHAPHRPGVIQGQARLRATHRPAALGATPLTARLVAVARPTLVVVALAAVGLAAAGWRGGGGPDTRAGEVAVVRAAGGSEGGLVVQDPRVGPIAPLHALVVGAWLRVTEAGGSLEGVIREAREPSRAVLAGVVGLTVLLFLLLMRVGPGSGAAAGPGPAPPQWRRRGWRLGGAALAGALVALDPLLVRNGRAATGTILAVALALGALALAWGPPARPPLRWVPLVGAVGGLALLVSPLALPVLAVPVVAELLEGRHRAAWRGMAALGLAVGLWPLLPIWVAGQGLDPGQVGWLLGRPPGRGPLAASLAAEPLSWLLVAAGLAAAFLTWRLRSGARSDAGPEAARLPAWAAATAAGALLAIALGYPASQALAFAIPAAAVSLAVATGAMRAPRWIAPVIGVALAGLLVAQGLSWGSRYGQPADDGLGRLVATVATQVPACSAVNAAGPDDRARLLAAGVTVTEYSSGPAAHAAGVRYFALSGATPQGGPQTRSLAAWIRQHGSRLADLPSPSLSGIELWRVDAAPLDPAADIVPIPGGIFSNVTGSACGGYRVVDSQLGAFHTGYRTAGGKAVLGRPLGTVWTSDGPALQAFDTMVLGATPSAGGPPDVKPIELPPLLAKLDVEAVVDADIPLPSVRPPVTDRQARALLGDRLIARAYLGTSRDSASAEDWRRARERFGRPLGRAQAMPDGAVRQPFERAVLELPADGGPVRPAALGRLAVRLGLVPRQAMRPEPVPGLPARPAEVRLDPSPLLRPLGVALALLAVAAAAGAVATRRTRGGRAETARTGR